MAHIFVKNSLNNSKAAKINLNLPVYVSTKSKGNPIWLLEVATTHLSVSGTKIQPAYINDTSSVEELDSAIADAVSEIANQIDWFPLVTDDTAPCVDIFSPEGAAVSIGSNVFISVKENMPSAGIDLSEAVIVIDVGDTEFDITSECSIHGDPFEYNISWEPPKRVYKRYEEE